MKMQTIIFFVRHGNVYNPTNVWYGRLPNFGLSKEGEKQIEQTANFLAKQNIDRLFSSPLLRAKQTATIINKKLRLPAINFTQDLLEIDSSLQGTSFSYIKTLNYDVFASSAKKDIQGETIEEVLTRMQKFVTSIINNHAGEKIVAVSHGDPIMLIKAALEGLPIINDSLRPGSARYMQQGEIYKITCDENIPLILESVFKPLL
ncbi:MAG TPA: histidine phosphatase family protein [Patescibacteria group bacterium]